MSFSHMNKLCSISKSITSLCMEANLPVRESSHLWSNAPFGPPLPPPPPPELEGLFTKREYDREKSQQMAHYEYCQKWPIKEESDIIDVCVSGEQSQLS